MRIAIGMLIWPGPRDRPEPRIQRIVCDRRKQHAAQYHRFAANVVGQPAFYMRLQFQESPIYAEIKAKGQTSKNPWREAFLSSNIKFVLIATIVVLGQGVVWYSGQFWALYFLQQVSKVDGLTTAYIVGAGLIIGTPTLIFFGSCGC
jgi:hypothetical protein